VRVAETPASSTGHKLLEFGVRSLWQRFIVGSKDGVFGGTNLLQLDLNKKIKYLKYT
jgi:hypothetical protein